MLRELTIQKDSYEDSVFLMLTAAEVKKVPGVVEAVVSMGTQANTELLRDIGFAFQQLDAVGPSDLVIAVEAEDEGALREAQRLAGELLRKKSNSRLQESAYRPVSLETALKTAPGANLAIVSVPGRYAAREARKALENGLHVMLFSDNVGLAEEIALKRLAAQEGLLMMGPDCGSAVINGKPLCFANVLRRGSIGLVSASGTGLQEVSCTIDRLGRGISQAIGTGGRDLDPEVGGIMTLMGIEALRRDPQTEVIVVVSKPAAEAVAAEVIARLEDTGKPCVAHFVGMPAARGSGESPPGTPERSSRELPATLWYAGNLEEAAAMAVARLEGAPYRHRTFTLAEEEVRRLVEKQTESMSRNQRCLRGLFTGGTLAAEALVVFETELGQTYSNIQTRPELLLPDPHRSMGNTIVDLGEDLFTRGRPHAMIDPTIRVERIEREMEDPQVALLLLDCVLGYGSHPDPAGAMAESIVRAKAAARKRGGHLAVVASLTGTEGDVQDLERQKRKLEDAGCLLMPSNYQAALLALRIVKEAAAR